MGTTDHDSMTSDATDISEKDRSAPRDGAQPPNGSAGLEGQNTSSKEWLERESLQAFGQNLEWWEANDRAIAEQHPDWIGKFVVVASRTSSKILGVCEDQLEALQIAARSPELVELAHREGLRLGDLTGAFIVGSSFLWDY
jgi:hypothetical protein